MQKMIVLLWMVGVMVGGASAADLTEKEILAGIDVRIENHRMGEADLKLLGADGRPVTNGKVLIEQTRHQFLFGCNIFKLNRCETEEENSAYEEYFSELFNFATLPFYWWRYKDVHGVPADVRTQRIVDWCRERDIATKGHPLAWNYRDPAWLPDDPKLARQEQMARIKRCMTKFKDDIEIWDVVNEATHYDRPEVEEQAPVMTRAISEIGVGKYLRRAFRVAREADPGATLVINDYRVDSEYENRVLAELVNERGEPLYAVIGIQSHMHGGYWGAEKAWEVCERYAKYGVPLHFTEVTIISGPKTDEGWNTTPKREELQARQALEFYRVLFSHPAVEAITWWDFSDQDAWKRAPAGFLRKDMTPKPIYEELKKMIKRKWWTKTTARSDGEGTVAFRGFYGDYKLTVEVDGKELEGVFHIDKSSDKTIAVNVK